MYGYVRPDKGELKVREYEGYRGVYCGLCHALKTRYGPVCRFLVNYDFTFLAMLLSDGEPPVEPKRCPYHPLRKTLCPQGDDGLYAAADCTVILAWWKLRDGIADGGFFSSLGCRAGCLALRRHYRKAASLRPDFAAAAEDRMRALEELEETRTGSMDAAADCFASLLRACAPAEGERRDRILRELLYHLGRIIYILDAVDDLPEDFRRGNYNPLLNRFSPEDGKLSPEEQQELRGSLQLSHNCLCGAYALMEPGAYGGILSNVIYCGLPAVTQAVFDGSWRSLKKSKRERSHL